MREDQTTTPIDAMVLPPTRITARLVTPGSTRRTYYRIKKIGSKGALLTSKGTFDAGIVAGARVEVLAHWRNAQATVMATVLHVTQTDPGRAYHAVSVQFEPGDGLDQLLAHCGIMEI